MLEGLARRRKTRQGRRIHQPFHLRTDKRQYAVRLTSASTVGISADYFCVALASSLFAQ
jgi:hypothetical protein